MNILSSEENEDLANKTAAKKPTEKKEARTGWWPRSWARCFRKETGTPLEMKQSEVKVLDLQLAKTEVRKLDTQASVVR